MERRPELLLGLIVGTEGDTLPNLSGSSSNSTEPESESLTEMNDSEELKEEEVLIG